MKGGVCDDSDCIYVYRPDGFHYSQYGSPCPCGHRHHGRHGRRVPDSAYHLQVFIIFILLQQHAQLRPRPPACAAWVRKEVNMVKEFVTRHRLLLMLPVLLFCFLLESPAEASAEEFPEFSTTYDGLTYEHYFIGVTGSSYCLILYNSDSLYMKCPTHELYGSTGVNGGKPYARFLLDGSEWKLDRLESLGFSSAYYEPLYSDCDIYCASGELIAEKKTTTSAIVPEEPPKTVVKAETAQELPTTLGSLAKTVVSSAGLLILCIMLSTALVPRLLRLFL